MSTDHIATFSKADDEKQIVYAEVFAPGVIDSQGDFMTKSEIELMAWRFMAQGRITKVDTEHNLKENGSLVIESFVAREGDPDFIPGSWVVGVHIPDPELWEQVKKGELNGFSLQGAGQRTEKVLEIEIPDDGIIKGDTEESEDHSHYYIVQFDSDGRFLGGETSVVNGHKHSITKGTATEKVAGHSHRYSFMEFIS